jgi:hypothetical protein
MGFELFVKPGKVVTPFATIWSRGQIAINIGAIRTYRLDRYPYAQLYFDPDAMRIGIRFVERPMEGAITVTKLPSTVVLSATPFLHHHRIRHAVRTRYRFRYDADASLYIIDLKQPMPKE